MVSRRFLGTATTDENGLAVLTDGYTGTGAGLVDIIAKTTIDESTIVSTPYPVMDCIQNYDDVAKWYVSSTATFDETDGVCTKTGTSGFVLPINPSTSTRFWTTPITIEFEVVTLSSLSFSVSSGNTTIYQQRMSTIGATVGDKVKIIYDGSKVIPYVNGVEKTSYIATGTFTTNFSFTFTNDGAWKDCVIYKS